MPKIAKAKIWPLRTLGINESKFPLSNGHLGLGGNNTSRNDGLGAPVNSIRAWCSKPMLELFHSAPRPPF